MAKRFTDTQIWEKEWFMKLSPKHKCLWRYITERCDQSGVWEVNLTLAGIYIGEPIAISDFDALGAQIEFLSDKKIFIPDFIKFQYGTLSEKSPAHKPIYRAIDKNRLSDRVFGRVSNTLQEKEEEKEEEKEKVITQKDERFNSEIAKILHKPYAKGSERGLDAKGQDVDSLIIQLQQSGWDNNRIRAQATAMRAYYARSDWPMPSNYIKLLTQFTENDWQERLKAEEPERKAEIISKANVRHFTPQHDEIGTSAPGSLG